MFLPKKPQKRKNVKFFSSENEVHLIALGLVQDRGCKLYNLGYTSKQGKDVTKSAKNFKKKNKASS